jgi:hypothetical protein
MCKVPGVFVAASGLRAGDVVVEANGSLRRIAVVEPEMAGHRGVTFDDGATIYFPAKHVLRIAYR